MADTSDAFLNLDEQPSGDNNNNSTNESNPYEYFITQSEFEELKNNPTQIVLKANSFIRDLQQQLETIKATNERDALNSGITLNETFLCSSA